MRGRLAGPPVSGVETRDRPVARVVLIDARDRVLLFDTRLTYTHVWMTPGGGVKPGESFEGAARRELWEEVGLADATLGPCVWTVRFRFAYEGVVFDQSERYFPVRVEAIEVRDDNREDAERNEIRGHRWWSLQEIEVSASDFRPRDLAALLPPVLRGDDPAEPVPALVERGARVL